MSEVLAYGFKLSENFGGPSVLHGFRAALEKVAPGTGIVYYDPAPIDPVAVSDMDFPVREFPYTKRIRAFLKDWARQKLLRRLPKDAGRRRFWEDYRAADAVVNIYAICFCGNWGVRTVARKHASRKLCLRRMLEQFLPNLVARLDGKVSVKSTSSYGELCTDAVRTIARWSARWCFTRMVAREEESRRQMRELAGARRDMPVAPDLANLLPYAVRASDRPVVGIVTSFQIERKWAGSAEGYLDCMRSLVRHVRDDFGCEVLLIPNQINGPDGRGDAEVADDILAGVPDRTGLSVFDMAGSGACALKSAIAACAAVVSPRYHSCVAALSSGVPLLTLGWHYKYGELMALYGQSSRALPTERCTVRELRDQFDRLWADREKIRTVLAAKGAEVSGAVLNSVKWMLEG